MPKYTQTNKIETFTSIIHEGIYSEYFTIKEIEIYGAKRNKGSLAARQLLKNMLIKYFDKAMKYTDIEILNNKLGKPTLTIKDYLAEDISNIKFSLSHSKKEVAVFLVI